MEIAKNFVRNLPIFTEFLTILKNSSKKISQKKIGEKLNSNLNLKWGASTSETHVKVMLDWARHLELAPKIYASSYRGKFRKQ